MIEISYSRGNNSYTWETNGDTLEMDINEKGFGNIKIFNKEELTAQIFQVYVEEINYHYQPEPKVQKRSFFTSWFH